VWTVNTTKVFNKALDNPTAYGAPNAVCYNSNGVSCLWWNDYHPGQAIQDLVAQSISGLIKSRAHAI
jgi:phospholipase/lecithinase/hemolysin